MFQMGPLAMAGLSYDFEGSAHGFRAPWTWIESVVHPEAMLLSPSSRRNPALPRHSRWDRGRALGERVPEIS
jgi:hypothetical protein